MACTTCCSLICAIWFSVRRSKRNNLSTELYSVVTEARRILDQHTSHICKARGWFASEAGADIVWTTTIAILSPRLGRLFCCESATTEAAKRLLDCDVTIVGAQGLVHCTSLKRSPNAWEVRGLCAGSGNEATVDGREKKYWLQKTDEKAVKHVAD